MSAQATVEAISDGINALHLLLGMVGQQPLASPPMGGSPLELAEKVDRLIEAVAELINPEKLESSYRPTSDELVRLQRLRTFVRLWADSGIATAELVTGAEECLDHLRAKLVPEVR